MTLENITKQGKLSEIFPLFDCSTIQHSDEIQRDRLTNKELCNLSFWTADFPMYVIEGKEAVLYMGRNRDNLIFDNITEAIPQLREKHNYFINDNKDIDSVIDSYTTFKFMLSKLKLKSSCSEWKYFEIDTEKYHKLNEAQRVLAERVYGKEEMFESSMEMLNNSRIKNAKIYVLNPSYVKKILHNHNAKGIARGSFLDNFEGNSNFGADSRCVDINIRHLRGVPLDKTTPSMEDILKVSNNYLIGPNKDAFEKELKELYRG